MRRIVAPIALLTLALLPGLVPARAHNTTYHCSGTAPGEMRCSVPFTVGATGVKRLNLWSTPGFVAKVTAQVTTATGSVTAVCTASGAGGYAPCVRSSSGTVTAKQAAVLSGTVASGGTPPTGRWMVEVNR